MTRHRKALVVAAGVFGGLFVALLAVPLLFEDRIEARVRAEIERATRVRVSWSDAGLSLLRDFPNPALSLRDLVVLGTGTFEDDTLASVESFRLSLGAGSVLGALRGSGPLVVRSVRIDEPDVRLAVDEDGTTSWDIMRVRAEGGTADDTGGAGRDLSLSLESLELSDGTLVLENRRSGLFVSLAGLGQSLSGDFASTGLVATSSTHADRTSVRFAGVPYLTDVTLDFDAELEVDTSEPSVRLLDNELRLNDLVLRVAGEAAKRGEDLALDLTLEAPRTEFGQLLSLVPTLYAQDFQALETSGSFAVSGEVRGAYGKTAFPSFALAVTVEDGSFRYPDLELPARAIAADLSIRNPGGDADSTVVDLSRFHIEIGGQPLDATLVLRTPVTDPDVDLRVEGTLDLADVARTVKLANAQELTGVIVADAAVRARRSDVDSARWERLAAEGTVSARDVTLRSPELRQPVAVEEAVIGLSPERAELRAFRAQLGSSDLQATGELENLLGFALGDAPIRGAATFTSQRFVLDEWRSGGELSAIPVPAMLDLTLDGSVERLEYGPLEMADARGRVRIADERITLERFSLETLGGRIGLDGYYETIDPAQPEFALDLALDSLDVAGASEAFLTVRTLAPVARYARGTFSGDLALSGALREDMTPVFDVLDGGGSLLTSRLAIEGFPLLERLSETLGLAQLARPSLSALRSSVRIEDGRLHVEPFQVDVGGVAMRVSGSNGIDQSLDYALGLTVPTGALGDAAASVVRDLASRAGFAGLDLGATESVRVGARVGGTVADPTVGLALEDTGPGLRERAAQAAESAVEREVEGAQQRLEASREEARLRARAQADSIMAAAEERAAGIRAEAARLAEQIRAEGNRAAEEVLARATNPIARAAAQPVAERLRQEAEERAVGVEREAAERADALVAEARRQAAALVGGG